MRVKVRELSASIKLQPQVMWKFVKWESEREKLELKMVLHNTSSFLFENIQMGLEWMNEWMSKCVKMIDVIHVCGWCVASSTSACWLVRFLLRNVLDINAGFASLRFTWMQITRYITLVHSQEVVLKRTHFDSRVLECQLRSDHLLTTKSFRSDAVSILLPLVVVGAAEFNRKQEANARSFLNIPLFLSLSLDRALSFFLFCREQGSTKSKF